MSNRQILAYDPDLRKLVTDDAVVVNDIARGAVYNAGAQACNVLNVSGVVIDTETITIGASAAADVFEVEQCNTDTTKTTTAALNTTQKTIPIEFGHGVVAGDIILIGTTEFCKVLVAAATQLTVVRGWGLGPAAHTTGAAVYKGAGYTAGNIPVPMQKTTLTAEAFIDHWIAVHALAKARGELKASADLTLYKLSAALVMAIMDEPGASDLATTETFTNAAWRAATMASGNDPDQTRLMYIEHVCTAQDVTNTKIYLPVPAAPKAILSVQVFLTTGIEKAQWNGVIAYVAGPPKQITLDNAGNADWADTDVIKILVLI